MLITCWMIFTCLQTSMRCQKFRIYVFLNIMTVLGVVMTIVIFANIISLGTGTRQDPASYVVCQSQSTIFRNLKSHEQNQFDSLASLITSFDCWMTLIITIIINIMKIIRIISFAFVRCQLHCCSWLNFSSEFLSTWCLQEMLPLPNIVILHKDQNRQYSTTMAEDHYAKKTCFVRSRGLLLLSINGIFTGKQPKNWK